MDCRQVEEMQIIERYLTERLTPEEEAAFEAHYFECDRCFSELKLRDAAGRELLGSDSQSFTVTTGKEPARARSKTWWWPLAAVALLILVLVPLALLFRESGGRESVTRVAQSGHPELPARLTEIEEMPLYLPATVRGGGRTNPRFQSGMAAYLRGDLSEAVRSLQEVIAANPENTTAQFYLGVSYLALNRPSDAVEQLETVLASGIGAYQEEARWYLAKAYFRLHRLDEARQELQDVVSMNGRFTQEAEQNLAILKEVTSGK